jgi:hypothetical protein
LKNLSRGNLYKDIQIFTKINVQSKQDLLSQQIMLFSSSLLCNIYRFENHSFGATPKVMKAATIIIAAVSNPNCVI